MKNSIILFNKNLPNQPVIIYSNAETNKSIILKDNKNRAGIYQWTHIESGKIYIGSAVNLSRRLNDYYSPSKLKRANSYICNALICHTHSTFSLSIIEYIDISNLDFENIRELIISREQYHIDTLIPEYNIQKIAGSSLGVFHTADTKAKLREVNLGKKTYLRI